MVLADATKLGAGREACCMRELAENRETTCPATESPGRWYDCGAMSLGHATTR